MPRRFGRVDHATNIPETERCVVQGGVIKEQRPKADVTSRDVLPLPHREKSTTELISANEWSKRKPLQVQAAKILSQLASMEKMSFDFSDRVLGEVFADFGNDPFLDIGVERVAQISERARRRDDD